jgi:hypothetical protein
VFDGWKPGGQHLINYCSVMGGFSPKDYFDNLPMIRKKELITAGIMSAFTVLILLIHNKIQVFSFY